MELCTAYTVPGPALPLRQIRQPPRAQAVRGHKNPAAFIERYSNKNIQETFNVKSPRVHTIFNFIHSSINRHRTDKILC